VYKERGQFLSNSHPAISITFDPPPASCLHFHPVFINMKFSIFALAAVLGLSAAQELIRCGTAEPNDTMKAQMNDAFFAAGDVSRAQAITVKTYVHIVTTSAKAGRYTQAQATEQVNPNPSTCSPGPRLTRDR
jgi:hypothetical protein